MKLYKKLVLLINPNFYSFNEGCRLAFKYLKGVNHEKQVVSLLHNTQSSPLQR